MLNSSPTRRKVKIYRKDVAEATGLKLGTIKKHIERGELDMDDLTSIAYFIVKRTLEAPEPKKE